MRTDPRWSICGRQLSQSANGSSGWQVRPARYDAIPRESAAAPRSASAIARGSGPERVAWKNARYGCCVGWLKCRWNRWTRIAVPPATTGGSVAPQAKCEAEPEVGGQERIRPLAR